MKKILNLVLILTIILCSSFVLVACGDKGDDYTPNLTKTYTANGFEIKTTSDFTLQTTSDGIKLTSEGDNQVAFGDTYFYAQYDAGNEYYDFANITLDQYTSDIAKIENINLSTPIKNINITEKLSDIFSGNLALNMYVVDEMQNPNGKWDYYKILCIGKGSNAFVYFNINTTIQDAYYNDNIEKFTSIISSTIFSTPSIKSYNNSAKSYISNTIVKTEDVMSYWNFEFAIPNDYIAYENPSYTSGNHLATAYSLEEFWSSTIRCSNLASFMGNAILNDDGAKHIIKFSTNNYLGFYTKNRINETSSSYNIYYLDSNNKLNIYYIMIGVSYSNDLNSLGFGNYFEEQMISWMQNLKILP
ncbi:MAG: hypothetical protein E7359_00385 [Clostridiales bacterium]|nr:hypothetical protein [Clostridiales bacterium]